MPARPTALGFLPSRLEQIDQFLNERYLDTGRMPGALFLVHRRGETAHMSIQGFADRERKVPLAEDTIFRIYSMTKPIASVALMMLFEEGRLQIDDPVAKYIPEWKDLGVYEGGTLGAFKTRPPKRPMLIVDLLRHTSGLTYGLQQRTEIDAAHRQLKLADFGSTSANLDDMIVELAKLPLEFSPGDHWNYSISTDVVGYLVGKISGMPFEDFLATRVFKPLGMADTGFFVPPEKVARFAACYYNQGGKAVLQDDPRSSPYLTKPAFISGGGGLVSTAADYLAFSRMLIKGGVSGSTRILSRKTIELMTANHLGGRNIAEMSVSLFSEAAYAGIGFGLGFAVTLDPVRSLVPGSAGEFSWGGMANTSFWIDPKEDLICILMAQLLPSTSTNIRRELRTLVYSAMTD